MRQTNLHSTNSQGSSQNERKLPVNKLLLFCARYQLKTANSADITDLLKTDINWSIVWELALAHGISMLVYQTLKEIKSSALPASVFELMGVEFQKRRMYNLFLSGTLVELVNLFTQHNIQAIPFKGPIWAQLGYGNIALRDFCDLDILVRPEDFSKAKDILIERGYYDKNFGANEESLGEAQMVLPDRRTNIDVHYKLTPRDFYLQVETESFFEDLQTLSFLGKKVATFSPENSLAISYLQGTKDSWNSLKRICDFGKLIQTYPEANWLEVMDRCETDENDRVFWLGVAIAEIYLRISLPEILAEKLKQFPEVLKIARQHKEYMYYKNMEYGYIFYIISLWEKKETTLWSKIQYVLNIVLTVRASDRESFPLPNILFFLYYPLRIFRLITSYKLNSEKLSSLRNLFKG
ncbi:nucleotidyltransferase domain-containing protein [Roseofilum casamattae]|uniref:Nucleotidyltransferase family protein n=1 Tax=Roseofilum casamattae BLCC-M143 TaxID=3022442 RepID=A0ABT7BRV0_9CYAN|nr:nucleotidyltransferase family protein [Roseofilum casamattae]MDJ1181923.1 nucleotidyltransferase family protein [Roseofilum casamattae BLCC-M143]